LQQHGLWKDAESPDAQSQSSDADADRVEERPGGVVRVASPVTSEPSAAVVGSAGGVAADGTGKASDSLILYMVSKYLRYVMGDLCIVHLFMGA